MPIPLVATKRYLVDQQGSKSRQKNFAGSNRPRTSETYRRQENIFGYEVQFLLSGVLPVFKNEFTSYREDCLVCCPSNKVIKSDTVQEVF